MSGAGISTSAGIPDFRSPETGLYANLARLNLPYAEAVFSIEYFRQRPEAFYTLAQELYPGKWRPTITHMFIALLHRKGLLLKHFTQNIDCLDREAGVPGEMVIEAHGSFATSRCIDCKNPYPNEEMLAHVNKMEIPRCHTCSGLVKPDIVFFGEALPAAFFEGQNLPRQADLVIVLGSSLSVAPFSQLPGLTSDGVPRLLVNNEPVGDMGTRADDVMELGDCDTGIRKLAEALGWLEELENMWNEIGRKFGIEPHPKPEKMERSRDEILEDEVNKMTREVEDTLNLTQQQTAKVMNTEAKPRIQPPTSQMGHSRVKSVEEWKAEFLAKYEKELHDEIVIEQGARERARLAAKSSPIPGWGDDKITTVGHVARNPEDQSEGEESPVHLGPISQGKTNSNSDASSLAFSSTATNNDAQHSALNLAKNENHQIFAGWTDPMKKSQSKIGNHGHMVDGTPLPGWNEERITMGHDSDGSNDGKISLDSVLGR